MPRLSVLVEVPVQQRAAFEMHTAALASPAEAVRAAESLLPTLAGYGLEVEADFAPVPMFSRETVFAPPEEGGFAAFAVSDTNPDVAAASVVIACEVDSARLAELQAQPDVQVWPNSEITLFSHATMPPWGLIGGVGAEVPMEPDTVADPFDLVFMAGGTDCRPFRPGVSVRTVRTLLGVDRIWADGFRGQNIVVGIIDEGVNGAVYPVVGGFSRPLGRRPGTAPITSHGSMCAADVLVAAPFARIYDYPFLGVPNSGGALQMFQAVLDQRRLDGTPHLTNNSYGFSGVPPREVLPAHEIWDSNHPLHRKVREVVASGAPAFFAAGNCGAECPSGVCHPSGIGPGRSIHASNSLAEVITVAAVNSRHERIGYSSQGPGIFVARKPDVAAYTHVFGNFGPGRPGGTVQPFDNGTSAATPVAAGVAALLMSAVRGLTPEGVREALIAGAIDIGAPGWDANTGHGVINAAASYAFLRGR
jgi:serine protease AprX